LAKIHQKKVGPNRLLRRCMRTILYNHSGKKLFFFDKLKKKICLAFFT
jgi:hypothetical protein